MKQSFIITLFICSFFMACNTIKTTIYDQYSYQQSISLKVETEALLLNGTYNYESYRDSAKQLLLEMEKMEEYEKNKPNNETSYKMWHFITNPDKNSVAGLFKLWKEKGQLSQSFLKEAVPQIKAGFDALIGYEIAKDKEKENLLLDIIKDN